jgi:type I restriction enzyme S subunit
MTWPFMRLTDLCKVITKGTTPTTLGFDFCDKGIGFLRVQNIEGGRVNYEKGTLFIDQRTHETLTRSQIRPGDVLVSIAGTIGRAGVVPENAPALNCNQAIAIVRANGSVFRPFLRHWLESSDAQTQMHGATVTGTISNLSLTQVGNLQVPLPSLAEQRQIAKLLDRAEALQAKRREALSQLDTLSQSIFGELFGDARQFELTTLSQVAALKRGPFGGALKKEIFVEEGYKVYEQRNAIRGDFLIGRYFIRESKYREMEDFAVIPHDLIVSCSGTLGKVAIVPDDAQPGVINQALLRIRVNKRKITPLYLKYVLESAETQNKLNGISHGTGLQNFPPMKEVKALRIAVPPIALQHDFTTRAAAVEKLKNTHCVSLAEMDALFSSLQHRAFRGQL